MMKIEEAFSYPFKDDDWPMKLLKGTVFTYIPIVNFFSKGYAYTVFKAALNKEELYMPEWDDYEGYFIKGFWVFFIKFCYSFIPLFLSFSGIGLTALGLYLYHLKRGDEFIVIAVVGMVFFLIGFILGFIVMVIYPMALANYAKGGERFGEAFRLLDIFSKVFRVFGDYVIAFLIMFCVVFVIFFLVMLPLIGVLFSLVHLVAVFYLYYLVWFGLVGRACSGAFHDDFGVAPVVPGK